MLLRPRQKLFVERSLAALSTRANTLGVAPTGAGKTIMLSAVTGRMTGDGAKACVLAHRDAMRGIAGLCCTNCLRGFMF
jgi:superfamily II DNA or RNA helicase